MKPLDKLAKALRPGPLSQEEMRAEAMRCAVDSRSPNMTTAALLERAQQFFAFVSEGTLPAAGGEKPGQG